MGSNIIYTAIENYSKGGISGKSESIKNDKKINKPLKDNIKPSKNGGKKRGRPKKDAESKKIKLNLHIEPIFIEILKKEAEEANYDLGPYIISTYIKKPLKEKYRDLKELKNF